ncbi:ARM repeat-containing protein [Guyanagaster necrorhizus]|uniref:ARM repeat-containing protein n=1 Tax=Guyanagaster necrorhizus TaxID=856835 RepID=A0A9P7VYY9_9AGAR|nr:ARM repeat-containing protein [Guyanagaster necrorhizus MCA 3950]KAG7450181.1 ARM repeat-containing protein [Guyanagaster necrorhizus MCA 3950]
MFEGYLGSPSPSTEAVVLLFGRVARHLDRADPRIPKIVDRLIEALKTPAEQVQIAVSDCLSPLVTDLVNASKYAARRGAAYGSTGVIKGTGIAAAVKEFNVINHLRAATEDKKRYEPRQGTMFAFEMLSSSLGWLFELSSAMVVPILKRGLREHGASTKKKAAQIVDNLASLTDSRDFIPYLPVPEARATAAKTLGTLVEQLGESHLPDLVPGLLRTLKMDTSGVGRQGAAQGLSEVLSGLGMERLEGLLPDIIANAQPPRATIREGFMSLLVYRPATFGMRFQPHLPKIITPILSVREILPELISQTIVLISSDGFEQQEVWKIPSTLNEKTTKMTSYPWFACPWSTTRLTFDPRRLKRGTALQALKEVMNVSSTSGDCVPGDEELLSSADEATRALFRSINDNEGLNTHDGALGMVGVSSVEARYPQTAKGRIQVLLHLLRRD